jgi:hypothetical protein
VDFRFPGAAKQPVSDAVAHPAPQITPEARPRRDTLPQ